MASIRSSLSSGILYTGATKYTGVLISIGIGAVLARILSPEEFGVVALITVFISFFSILSDVGIGPAIIQHKELTEEDVESIFLFTLILGVLLAILFYYSSTFIASFYNNVALIPLIRLLSLSVLFNAWRTVPNALLLKKLKFKQVGIVLITVQLCSGVFAIVLAYQGFSYYALVYKSIFDGLFFLLAFYFLAPVKIKVNLSWASLSKILTFSTFQFFFNFINYFSRNTDNLLIGRFIGPVALGYYDKSYQLMLMPVQNLTRVITPVLHPVLSEYQDDRNRIYFTYLKVVRLLATLGFPLSVFLYFNANEIIHIFYGPKWRQSIPVFEILALTVGIQILLSSSGAIFQAVNRTDLLFYSGFLSAIFMVCGICYGVFVEKSLLGIGYGLVVAFICNFLQGFYFLIKLALGSSFFGFIKLLFWPIITAGVLSVALSLVVYIDLHSVFLLLLLKIVLSMLVFVVVNLFPRDQRTSLFKLYGTIIAYFKR